MSNNFKFEFDFDEVLEGVKQGVIRELSETNFEAAKNNVINQLKSEIKNEIKITYKDEYELKDEIKKEVKDKVFKTLIDEVSGKYLNQFDDYVETQLIKNPERLNRLQSQISSKVSEELYNNLYSDLQREINSKVKTVVSKIVNNLGGNNLKVKGTNQMITKEEYDNLIHRNEILEALEQGGVDNWEWYGESLNNYFRNDNE